MKPRDSISGEGDYDVIVVGAGLVGAAAALALARLELDVALVEQLPPAPLPQDADDWDSRVYAVTPGNAGLLRGLGVWDALDAQRIAPIRGMAVWGDDGKAMLGFDPYAAGHGELGWIVESRLLQHGLWQQLQREPRVGLVCPAHCDTLDLGPAGATLALEDGRRLHGRLVVGADGAASWVRSQAGIGITARSYRQVGVVANFATEREHEGIARQWFLQDGILAWLPLPGRRISIVWSAFEAHAQALLQMDAAGFTAAVAEAGGHALGELRLITPPAGFPLRLQRDDALVGTRLALIGDAAHQVHPLAGQGVNLGFRDVRELAAVLQARSRREPGDALLLRRYERARKADILAMQAVTTGLQQLFNNHDARLRWLRNAGLSLTNRIAPLKRALMTRAIDSPPLTEHHPSKGIPC